ncbi:hypothetical protein BOO86_23305 [Mycobacterium sp. CBMA 234]|uniref:hypothetical protein n=1 Tax=Mycolicibacterium sp. CBMA 234 TaxID=1918495 RepID=UPI0012DD5680|nr:hypothetical protein [Mycolicibacterium sp. CBMA 234]MUL67421.1 hypothetical protein [Mycolicibacterium sp. CBMA 234]
MRVATVVGLVGILLGVGLTPTASADPVPLPEAPVSPGTTFVDDPAIVDAHPLAAQSWSRMDPEPQLALNFEIGSPECYGVHATVQETEQTVVVTLTSGRRYLKTHMVCTMIMVPGKIFVPLANPVGDRAVLAGE